VKRQDDVYGELENGTLFLLTPEWLKNWEQDERNSFEVPKQEEHITTIHSKERV